MSSKNFNMSFDPDTKQKFAEVVAGYGLTVPQAFKLLANQVIHTGVLPLSFDWQAKPTPKVINEMTKMAIDELENGKGTVYDSPEDAMQAILNMANSQ